MSILGFQLGLNFTEFILPSNFRRVIFKIKIYGCIKKFIINNRYINRVKSFILILKRVKYKL
jgi:hypothetical protein